MNNRLYDERIKAKLFSWKNVVATYLALLLIHSGQELLLVLVQGEGARLSMGVALGLQGYWAIFAALLCMLAKRYIQDTFVLPIRRLGEAAKRVTEGDFSIYVAPAHAADQANCLDVMTEDFNRMVASLGSGEVLKSDFIANVSHEIRTPVAIIESSAELLERPGLTPEEQKKYITDMLQSARHLVSLTGKLLTLKQLENSPLDVETQECCLYEQLCSSLLNYEQELDEKQIELDIAVDETITISANPYLMEIVWDNLISNAVKFSHPGGKICLRASQDDKSISVSIRDNGCGMSEDTMLHAFDRFFQGDISHAQEGNGLGLSLAQAAAQLAHGTISVQSIVGIGSEFTVHLG